MAKKQKSFADKASGKGADADSVMVKYVKSVKSEKTGFWRFNEQMIKIRGGENLDAALKRMDEALNLVDIDLSEFESKAKEAEENPDQNIWDNNYFDMRKVHFARLEKFGRSKFNGETYYIGSRGGIYTISANGTRNYKY